MKMEDGAFPIVASHHEYEMPRKDRRDEGHEVRIVSNLPLTSSAPTTSLSAPLMATMNH